MEGGIFAIKLVSNSLKKIVKRNSYYREQTRYYEDGPLVNHLVCYL